MKIHALYSQPHYGDHLRAIYRHLPDGIRGRCGWTRVTPRDIPHEDVIMIAGAIDLGLARNHRTVFVEHGAGQRYVGIHRRRAVYYGGPYPSHVVAYLGPRQSLVDASGLPGAAIGAPICDEWGLHGREKVCAITFHWAGDAVCPEAGSALPDYVDGLPDVVSTLRENGWTVLGHRHPRLKSNRSLWLNLGVEEVDAATVRGQASLLISDNTSLAYEMAYCARSNIVMNCPKYRRDVEHGLRFWSNPPGPQVDNVHELIDVIQNMDNTIQHPSEAARAAYGAPINVGVDGMRAAAWLTLHVDSCKIPA